jgi:hypothetical protein
MTSMVMPSCGETPDIQRAIPIAMKRNPHRWMFFIVPKLIMASRFTSRFHSSKQVQRHSRVFMDFSLFSLRLTRGHGVIFAKTLARGGALVTLSRARARGARPRNGRGFVSITVIATASGWLERLVRRCACGIRIGQTPK